MQPADYYRFLATALPPAELADAAWRRLRRTTLRQLHAVSGGASPAPDLAVALQSLNLEEVAERLKGLRAGRGPLEPNELQEARRLIKDHLPGHAKAVCERADRVLDGDLYLFGAWRPHARGELSPGIAATDWRRDPLHGGQSSQRLARDIDRDAVGTDARAVWEAARLAHVVWLAQAHVVAGLAGTEEARGTKERGLYARAAALHVRDFIATQPVGRGIHWTCPMEAALRVMHLSMATLLLRSSPDLDAQFWVEAAQAIWQHAKHLEIELEDAQAVPGNHLLADLAGLATVGLLFPELPEAMPWRAWALPAFARELVRQTGDDGFAFEASLPYHRLATELGLWVQALARRQGLSLGAPALGRLWRMCDVVERTTLADGKLPNLGDNDSSHGFSFVPRPALDGAHVTALRAALGGPGLCARVEPEALWLGGLAGLRRNVALASTALGPPRPAADAYAAGGLAVLQGDQGRSVTLWAGENGQRGLGGHAHNDKLSSEICLLGRRVTVDSGCPVYLCDPEERDRYRGTAAHPTVQVDHLEQAPIPAGRPFLLPDVARAHLLGVEARRALGEHRGYWRLRPPVLHRREVALPERLAAVVVTDRLLGEGAHVADVLWPLATRALTLREATATERALLDRLEALSVGEGRFDPARVVVLDGDDGRPFALCAVASELPFDLSVVESTWSPGYGERHSNRTVRVTVRAQLPLVVTTAFVALSDASVQ